MSLELFDRIETVYRYVQRAQHDLDVRARVVKRQEEMLRVEVVGIEQARLGDLNAVVAQVVAEALPVCRALGVRLRVWQTADMPRVPLLVEPLQHTLAGLIDLCLDDDDVHTLELRTWSELDCVVVGVERRVLSNAAATSVWREVNAGDRVELLVGAQALRALGGALSMRSRGHELVCRIEVPRGDSIMPLGECYELPEWRPAVAETHYLNLS
jgi:hypothetical protein